MPAQFTTDLPAASGLQLDASVEDELTATWTDVLNNGEFHLELRDDDPDGNHPDYQDEATVGVGTTSHQITGLQDGEQYSVRLRTQTAYKTGSWLEAEDITKFPAPDSLTASTSATSVSLDWAEYADNDSGSKIFRARVFDGSVESFEQIGTTGADDTTVTDDGVLPQREYRYYVREHTEWVYADTEEISATADATGKPTSRIPASGWYVEIDAADGSTHRPSVLDEAQIVPKVNGLPRVRIPVTKSTKWQADAFEKAAVRVWHDGERQPAEVLLDVEQQPGRTVLVARGGEQLRERVEAEYASRTVHEFAEELVASETCYATNVDTPSVEETEDVVQDVTTDADWAGITQTTGLSSRPVDVANGLSLLQSCFTADGYDGDEVADGTFSEDTAYSGDGNTDEYGAARWLDTSGQVAEWTFTTGYEIPEGQVGIWIRAEAPGSATPETRVYLDGNHLTTINYSDSFGRLGLNWRDYGDDGESFVSNGWTYGDLAAGEHTIRVEITQSASDPTVIDHVALADNRYDITWDEEPTWVSSTSRNALDGPEHYPIETIRFDVSNTVLSVIGGDLTTSFDSVDGQQAVGITNDGDDALVTASNTETVSADWASRTGEIQAEATLSRWPIGQTPQGRTPRYGYNGQSVDSLTLTAQLDDMPLVLDRQFDATVVDVLRELAEQLGDSVFAFEMDDSGGRLEWAEREQRTTTVDASLADFNVTTTRDPIERAIVYGSNQSVRREQLTAEHGTAVSLQHERLLKGSVDVYDPDTQETFDRGADYEISHRDGTITALAGGDLVDGAAYRVDYEHQTRGEFVADGVDPADANTEVRDITGLTTDRACGQAALRIVETGLEPHHEVEATWPSDVDLPPVTDALVVDGLPIDTAVQTQQIDAGPAEIVTTGGSRRPVEDVIREIDERFSSISRRV
jgi:hypothetical protein